MTMSIESAPVPIWFHRKFSGEPEELLTWSWTCPHPSSTMTQIFGESTCMSSVLTAPPMHSRCRGSRRRACSSLWSSRRWLLWWADCFVGDIRLGEEAREEVIRGGRFHLVWDSFILILPCIFLHSWLYRLFHRPMSQQLSRYILHSFWSPDHQCHIFQFPGRWLVSFWFLHQEPMKV